MTNDIFKPFHFKNGLALRNKVLMAPMTTSSSTPEGFVTEEELIYYLTRSSQVGAVITACAYISSEGQAFKNGMSVAKDNYIPGLKKLARVIQLQGAKAIMQIYHGGRMSRPTYNGDIQPVAPSSIKAERDTAVMPKEVSLIGIQLLINQFKEAVRRAIIAGYDGVELHGANTYLLQQFVSPNSNQRTDQYGGNFKNRLRFPLEVIKACQEVINQYASAPFILGYRLSPEEKESPGIRLEDTLSFTDYLIDSGIDYIHLSVRCFDQPSLLGVNTYKKPIPQLISERIGGRVPLINVGRISNSQEVKSALSHSELISVGRQLIVDPKTFDKIYEDKEREVNLEIDPKDQYCLKIPSPLWQQIIKSPNWFPLKEEPTLNDLRDGELMPPVSEKNFR